MIQGEEKRIPFR